MLNYNLKDFFQERIIHNDDWVTNGHFLFKKSILTTGQRKMLEEFPQDDVKIKQLSGIVNTAKEIFDDTKIHFQFVPEVISKREDHNVLYNRSIDLALNEGYYNLFTSKNCKIYKGNGNANPTLIFDKDNNYVGILLPIRSPNLENSINYNDYITELKQQQQEQEELKKLNKSCLYISNNKAVIRNKPLRSVAELTGNDKYKNIYVTLPDDNYSEIFIDLGIIYMSLNRTIRENDILEDTEYYFNGYENITLDNYKKLVNQALDNNRWITVSEVKLMELAGEPKEYIEKLLQHRENIIKQREEEDKRKHEEKERQEQKFLKGKEEELNKLITESELKILNKEKLINKEITIYTSKYDYNTTSLILHLFKTNNINIPLKTQGWINQALYSIYYDKENNCYSYQYYKTSRNSTVFNKYLDQLVEVIKDKYKAV